MWSESEQAEQLKHNQQHSKPVERDLVTGIVRVDATGKEASEHQIKRLQEEIRSLRRLKSCFKFDRNSKTWYAPCSALAQMKLDPFTMRDMKKFDEPDPVDLARAQADHFMLIAKQNQDSTAQLTQILWAMLLDLGSPVAISERSLAKFSGGATDGFELFEEFRNSDRTLVLGLKKARTGEDNGVTNDGTNSGSVPGGVDGAPGETNQADGTSELHPQ